MSKRGNKELYRSVPPCYGRKKTHASEDFKDLRSNPDAPFLSMAANERYKDFDCDINKRKRQKEDKKSNKKKYEVSDSSDEDLEQHVISNITSSVDGIPQSSKDTRRSDNTPSTSKVNFDTTEFLDDLLKTNKELLNGSFMKPYDQLCIETDQLLASSLELFNENNPTNSKDSLVFVCTDKDTMKTSPQESLLPIKSVLENAGNKAGQACPICLETLGGDLPAWSTFCGHVFCKNCIENWIRSQKNCPTCRKRLTIKKIHQLFLSS